MQNGNSTTSASTAATCPSPSFLTPVGYRSTDCGYCKEEDSSASYYATSKSLCPRHYQLLMDRGWRRSGTLLYMPDAVRSCCPHYTIRLPTTDFKPNRDQRQALHRWNRFVLGEKYMNDLHQKYPQTKAEKKEQAKSFDLVSVVHESEAHRLKPGLEPDHTFTVSLEADEFTEEKYALFNNYQRHVHHEDDSSISPHGFQRFLCGSPLHRETGPDGQKYGSYHQCYCLDGRLIAMAVLDLLPHAVSGVYFIYHSDYEKWSFGKLSALREAALALESGYEFYYMGYYIHSCKKMRYKADYRPQNVLDYYSGEWHVLDDGLRALMDRYHYASPSRERASRRDGASAETLTAVAKQEDRVDAVADTHVAAVEAETHHSPKSAIEHEDTTTAATNTNSLLYPVPADAARSGLSLLVMHMPGVMSWEQVQRQVDLDRMHMYLGPSGSRAGTRYQMQDLVAWEDGDVQDPSSIKGTVAEFAACVGPLVAQEILVDFSHGG